MSIAEGIYIIHSSPSCSETWVMGPENYYVQALQSVSRAEKLATAGAHHVSKHKVAEGLTAYHKHRQLNILQLHLKPTDTLPIHAHCTCWVCTCTYGILLM